MLSTSQRVFRQPRIGGSDLPAILGKAEFGGPASVAQRILGMGKRATRYNAALEFGNRWESLVAQLFSENHPEFFVVSVQDAYKSGLLSKLPGFRAVVVELDDGSITLIDPEYDFLVYNVDYLLVSRTSASWGVLEIKTASEFVASKWGPSGTSEVPSYYEDQPKHYCAGLGGSVVYVACLIGQRDYREYPLPGYEERERTTVVGTLVDWYERHCVAGIPVAPSFKEASTVEISEGALEAPAELIVKIQQHRQLHEQIKALESEMVPLEENIRAAAAIHDSITINGEVVFKNDSGERFVFDHELLARERPDIYGQYLKPVLKKRFAKAHGYYAMSEHKSLKIAG